MFVEKLMVATIPDRLLSNMRRNDLFQDSQHELLQFVDRRYKIELAHSSASYLDFWLDLCMETSQAVRGMKLWYRSSKPDHYIA